MTTRASPGELGPFVEQVKDYLVLVGDTVVSKDRLWTLVGYYDTLQELCLGVSRAERALARRGLPTSDAPRVKRELKRLEKQITRVLTRWTSEYPVGRWALQQRGVGAVTVATLLARLDVEHCRTAEAVWRRCGLDPTVKQEKGEKSPYDKRLEQACWLLGESFRSRYKSPDCFYGQVYAERKAYEQARNQRGDYAQKARVKLASRRRLTPHQRLYLERGMLTPGHIDARALRYAVKLFLAHFAWVYWETECGEPWPAPYPVVRVGGVVVREPPGYTPLARRSGGREFGTEAERWPDGDQEEA